MEYISLNCLVSPIEPGVEILMAQLAELGFESFQETEAGLIAYIQKPLFDIQSVDNLDIIQNRDIKISYAYESIADQNWNAKWEENYDPIVINQIVAIRAPFHSPYPDLDFDIVIEPKMSFGTAHHGTTAQMIQLILTHDMKGKRVLDMGCGTGVLAILAAQSGAISVDAIDNDEWAYRNSLENVEMNQCAWINVMQGDAALLKGKSYDLIIANINRNILLADLKFYSQCLEKDKLLFMSGFYPEDIEIINEEANKHHLFYQYHTVDRGWVAGVWIKK